jgi:transcriptional regulator with XRE-family HTH domain
MANHPNRRARGGPSPSGLLLRDLRERAGLTQAQAGALVRVSEIAWRSWENGARRMPAPAMELLCIVLAVGTVERGPYVPPGDWMLPWVRDVLCLWFRSGRRVAPAHHQPTIRSTALCRSCVTRPGVTPSADAVSTCGRSASQSSTI